MDHFVRELLLDDLLHSDSLPSRILFDPQVRSIYLEEFWGITGCWTATSGTHFFWGVQDREFLALRVDPDRGVLQAAPGTKPWDPVPLTAEAIQYRAAAGRVAQEEATWQTQWSQQTGLMPELNLILLLHVTGTENPR